MVNYHNSKIYKIVCNVTGLNYIGSTTKQYLSQRLDTHKSGYKRFLNGFSTNYVTSFKVLENRNFEIVLLELCNCETKDELHARERHYIETVICVNKNIAGRKPPEYYKEYYINNKEHMKQYYIDNIAKIKQHYIDNRESLKKYQKERYHKNKNI